MCLALFAFRSHPRYPLVIAANRDERHERPTARAAWWPERILAGRDLDAGGTWLGVTRGGRWALVTNYREGEKRNLEALSRGTLVVQSLLTQGAPFSCVADVLARGARFNGFNLVVGDSDSLAYGSNRDGPAASLAPGVYALSNHLLDTPWPKLSRTRKRFAEWMRSPGAAAELLPLLRDTTTAPDSELPATGVNLEWERLLSSPFVINPSYGTRSSTAIMVDAEGEVDYVERSFDAAGQTVDQVQERFVLDWVSRR